MRLFPITYFRLWLPLLLTSFLLVSCQEEDGLETQPHDENRMMAIMHQMMAEMNTNKQLTHDPDLDYAAMMIQHHRGAINMANEELARGDDAMMKALAQKIKTEQEQEIQEFNAFLASQQPDLTDMAFGREQMQAMEKMSRESDIRVLTGDTDQDFAQLMIPHHQAALENSQSLLHHGNNAEMKAKAQAIIDSQLQDIQQLQEWILANKEY